jgi:hypothetical protein
MLQANARFVREPDLFCASFKALRARDARQRGGEVSLNASMAPSACAWWRARADSLR